MKRLCRKMDIPLWQAVGILEMLWQVTAREAPRGDIGKLSDEDIALGLDYRGDEGALIGCLVDCGWIDRVPEFRLVIHDWQDHCDDSVHMKLARAQQYFVGGEIPKIARLGGSERKQAQEFYNRAHGNGDPCAHSALAVREPRLAPPCPALPFPSIHTESLFDEQTSTNSPSVVRPDVPPAPQKRKNGSGRPMSSEQREWLNEFLTFHPKNTIQTASATKLWAERVKEKPCFEWLMAQLKRECAGDTTYLHGPGKWLADHLELYAAGVEAHSVRRSGKPDPVLDLMEENFKRSGRIFA